MRHLRRANCAVQPGRSYSDFYLALVRQGLVSFALYCACCALTIASASAQEIPGPPDSASSQALYLLSPRPNSEVNPLLRPGRDYRGIAAGSFLLYPGLLAGAVIDDNLAWSHTKPGTAAGLQLRPELIAVRDTGKHKTTIYGLADLNMYPSITRGNTVGVQAGIAHNWEITKDMVFKAHAGFVRSSNYVAGGFVTNAAGGAVSLVSPQTSDIAHGSVALQRTYGRVFTGASLKLVNTQYAALHTTGGIVTQNYRDNLLSELAVRAGVWMTPVLYGFAEVAANMRHYTNGSGTAQGQTVVAGLGSDRISLFRGEVFAGVQRQTFSQPLLRDSINPLFGGKLYWYPTRALTISTALNQKFVDTSAPSPGNPNGFPKRETAANVDIHYKMSESWSASLRGGYAHSTYQVVKRTDNAMYVGATWSYDMRKNLTLTLGYDYYKLLSNDPSATYTHSIYRVGAKYRY